MSDQLLKGTRVLDFTQFLAGPYCGMFMSDMGAEVIKVENLKSGGDFVRGANPIEKNSGLSMYFQNLNRGKKSVALDLKAPEGKLLFAELVKSADVLLENNRPGVMDKLGFGYKKCSELNPKLIFASISGFGQTGAYSSRPGYDLIGQAMGGGMSITGWPDSEPTRAGMAISDIMAGMNCCIAICASLYKRVETGLGQQIDVSLVDTVVSGLEAKMMEYIYTGQSPPKTGNRYITSAPYDSFKAKDTYYVIASGTDVHFRLLSAMMGAPELAENPLYCNTKARQENHHSLKKIVEEWSSDKTAMECVNLILGCGVPAGPIYDCAAIRADKVISEERGMFIKVHHPKAGELEVLGNPIKMGRYPCRYDKAAPELGESNAVLFGELGFSDEQLEEFRKLGVMN